MKTLCPSSYLALLVIGLLSALGNAATVEGYVRDSAGTAVAAAVIRVQLENDGLKNKGPAADVQTVRADAAGAYRFSSLHKGTYTLHATGSAPGEAVAGPFVLGESESKKLDLVLRNATASAEFFDEPKFTVAGVTEHAYVGGHGSDAVVRSAEALSKATNALSKPPATPPASNANEKQLRVKLEREQRASQADSSNPSLHHLIANDYELLNQPLEAVREYQRAAELDPSETNLFDWGTELLIHRALEPAAQVYAQGNRLFPLSSRMLLGSAVALYANGDYTQAARQFFAATDLNPADPGPYLFLAKVESPEIKNAAGFRERLARFAKLDPENAWANYYYALCLSNDAEMLTSVQLLLEKAVRLDPKLSVAYLQLGMLFAEKHNYQAAIPAYQKALEADPHLEQAHYRLAQAYRETGDAQNAQKEIAAFRQLSKTSAGELERQRSDLQQFVVSLKNPSSK